MMVMKRMILILSMGLATPALAQDEADGPSLMERGAQLLMEGLLQEIEPSLEDLHGLAEEFGPAFEAFTSQMAPALRDLLAEVEDWSVYHPPEMLENGDIIIRRRAPEEAPAPTEPEEGPIDL
mmetsp:Transcript_22977/g.38754  ORF Transcript_22977/g.38754 Transcript_22977/m.38754 type:complete len:123 (+) Transcript_22977:3091-3459(+)